jgi:hypothetical protein
VLEVHSKQEEPPMSTVSGNEVVSVEEVQELALPASVQEALGELVHCAKEGLLALSVGVGLGVLAEMLEAVVDEVVGRKGKHNPDRTALRHGHDDGEVTLGGRRVAVKRPRARTADGGREVPLATYEHFADRDPLSRHVLEQMLAGVSTRRYGRTLEPLGEEIDVQARSMSKSAVRPGALGGWGVSSSLPMVEPTGDRTGDLLLAKQTAESGRSRIPPTDSYKEHPSTPPHPRKSPANAGLFEVAGAGFEPATFGL